MKNKDIKDILKTQALKEMPDVFSKINLDEIRIEPRKTDQSKPKTIFHLKLAFSAFMLVIASFFVYQIIQSPQSTSPSMEEIQVLSIQTVSASALVEYGMTDYAQTLSLSEPLTDQQADQMAPYLEDMAPMIHLAEMLVNQRDQMVYNLVDSSDPDYQYQVVFSTIDLRNQSVEYHIYFNQDKTSKSGYIRFYGNQYAFTDDQEGFRLYLDSESYIEVEEANQNNDFDLNFSYFKNQSQAFTTSFSLREENGQYQGNFQFQNNRGLEIAMAMRRSQTDAFDVDYQVKDMEKSLNGRYQVQLEENQTTGKPFYRFKFDDESEQSQDRPGNQPNGRPNQDDQPGQGPNDKDQPGNQPNKDDHPGNHPGSEENPGNRPF